MSDLSLFSAQFGLPAPTNAQTSRSFLLPAGSRRWTTPNWNIEEALDIEMGRTPWRPMRRFTWSRQPSSNFTDLLRGGFGRQLPGELGRRRRSFNKFGAAASFQAKTSYDHYFAQSGIVYFASSGDSPGVNWPSTSSETSSSVGGTSLSRNPTTGNFQGEVAWQSGGGGPSIYETRPPISDLDFGDSCRTSEGTPDVGRRRRPPRPACGSMPTPYWYILGGNQRRRPPSGASNRQMPLAASLPRTSERAHYRLCEPGNDGH